MEAFSLLKYWRNSGSGSGGGVADGNACTLPNGGSTNLRTSTTTIVTAVSSQASETDDDEGNDDGPFFDLEFTVPDEDEAVEHSKNDETDDDEDVDSDVSDGEDESELKFTLSSGSSGDCTDPTVSVSPSDDLFFKGRLVPIEHSSTDLNGLENNSKLHFPVSLVKSATKFRVMMLKLKKSKSNISENAESKTLKKDKVEKLELEKGGKEPSKFFTVKFKANEMPIVSSLFVRDNSSKNLTNTKPQKQNLEESVVLDERRFSKESVQRYLKKVKPLYVRVSKRYGEKLKFSGQLSLSGTAKEGIAAPPCSAERKTSPAGKNDKALMPEVKEVAIGTNVKSAQKESLPAGLRVVCKHLGKSRSASSAAVAAATPGAVLSKRRDDSLLQQQDGIQSAILHCKRSFKASRERSVSADGSSGDKETCR